MRSAVTSYVGNGTSQSIAGIGFEPDLVIVTTPLEKTVFSIATAQPDKTIRIGQDDPGDDGYFAGGITSFDADGFSVGSRAEVNSNGVTYYAVCLVRTGITNFWEGTYVGNAVDDTDITAPGFQPIIAWVKRQFTDIIVNGRGVLKTTAQADPESRMFVLSLELIGIKSLISTGFRLGVNHRVNRNGTTYWGVAIKSETGYIAQGSYAGDGTGVRSIGGVGFIPQVVMVVSETGSSGQGVNARIRFSNFVADTSWDITGGGSSTGVIRDFEADGFEVGAVLNGAGDTYYWLAWGPGFLPPLSNTGYPRRIRAHPADAQMLVADGRNSTGSAEGMIFVSVDAGVTWSRKGRGGDNDDGLSWAVNYINSEAAGWLVAGRTDSDAGNTIRWILSQDHGDTWTEILSFDDSGSRAIDVLAAAGHIWLLSDKRLYQIDDDHAVGTPSLIANCNAGGIGPEAAAASEYQAIAYDPIGEWLYLAIRPTSTTAKLYRRRVTDVSPSWADVTGGQATDLGYEAVPMRLGTITLLPEATT